MCKNKMKSHIYILTFALSINNIALAESYKHSYTPKNGYVPDEKTAIKIAEAIWLPIYGEHIYNKKPFVAILQGEVWVIQGSLPSQMIGGVPIVEISKKTGKIIRVSHGK